MANLADEGRADGEGAGAAASARLTSMGRRALCYAQRNVRPVGMTSGSYILYIHAHVMIVCAHLLWCHQPLALVLALQLGVSE